MKSKIFASNLGSALVLSFLTLLFVPIVSITQLTRGTISGTMRDTAGAAIPGATVKITNVDTNQTRTATTNESGFYRVTALEPGNYTVLVEKTGFGKFEARDIVVR